MEAQLNECRWLYNELLSQRKLCYEELGISLSKYEQSMLLPLMKEERPPLEVHSQVLQNVVDRLNKSFQAFFRRCKAKEKPGFPRFRGEHRYNSFCYPQSGFTLEWTVSFSCEVAIEPRALAEESIGIDVGLQHFATFSNGQ